MSTFLPFANHHDLSNRCGNGPFGSHGSFLGVILHVNVDQSGTPLSFWGNNPNSVCPNFQVYKDGKTDQLLPLDWQPWCQIDGNYRYAAIETAGLPNEPLTIEQIKACAKIVKAYHQVMGMPLRLAEKPGDPGLGTHQMGGASWGGHPCPGVIRSAQRKDILSHTNQLLRPDTDWTVDMTEEEFEAKVDERIQHALFAFASGSDSEKWTHHRNPILVPGPSRGVYDRLAKLEKKNG